MNKMIDRDAGDKSKGPRLQKLRALELLFNGISQNGASHVYVATEFEGDVSLHAASTTHSEMYVEENKNYDVSQGFTFASDQVLNTMVSFLDSWVRWQCSEAVEFGFYCPNSISKERQSQRTRELGIQWPEKPVLEILESLASHENLDDSLVDNLASLIKDEYAKQYTSRTSNGCKDLLDSWDTDQWHAFFKKIKWRFGQSDDHSLKKEVISLVKQNKHYCQHHSGKEEHILALAMELLDERQSLQEPTDRFVYSSDIENLFLKTASSAPVSLPDPAWEMWESLPPPTDTRNIASKVRAVDKTASDLQIGRWSRKAASGFNTEQKFGTDKSILALKYRIYTACSDRWEDFIAACHGKVISSGEIRSWVSEMASHCKEVINDLEGDHAYRVSNSVFVEELIWVLIDECYLSFDAEPAA